MRALLEALAYRPEKTQILAGGQSLVPRLNERSVRPDRLIDINDLTALDYIRQTDEHFEIGALTRHYTLESSPEIRQWCPIVPHAARHIGHRAIRSRGTIGGSLVNADPAAEIPVLAVLLDSRIQMRSASGSRIVPACDFFLSPGQTARAADEILVAVGFPKSMAGEGWSFQEFSRPGAYAWALVIAAATIGLGDNGRVERMRAAVGGAAATPLAMGEAITPFLGETPDDVWIAAVTQQIISCLSPADDLHALAQYRRELAEVLVPAAIREALGRCVTADKTE